MAREWKRPFGFYFPCTAYIIFGGGTNILYLNHIRGKSAVGGGARRGRGGGIPRNFPKARMNSSELSKLNMAIAKLKFIISFLEATGNELSTL